MRYSMMHKKYISITQIGEKYAILDENNHFQTLTLVNMNTNHRGIRTRDLL